MNLYRSSDYQTSSESFGLSVQENKLNIVFQAVILDFQSERF